MKYNIIHDKKIVFFWLPKSGTLSLIRLMILLKFGDSVNPSELHNSNSKELFKIYLLCKEEERPGYYYGDFDVVFFGRNPFHRILSAYLDKYVNERSITPKINPGNLSYEELICRLKHTKMGRSALSHFIDFETFCPASADEGYDFYEKIGRPTFSYISQLMEYGFPEGALHHSLESMLEILKITRQGQLLDAAKILSASMVNKEHEQFLCTDIAQLPRDQVRELIRDRGLRSIDARSFYPKLVQDTFVEAYEKEFKFYEDIGMSYKSMSIE